jgi:hypothetical protein
MSKKLRFFSDLLSRTVNEIEYKNVLKKLKKHDLIADVDDQYYHHFTEQHQSDER